MLHSNISKASRKVPAAFRYRNLGGRVLLTNYFGDWHWLERAEFRGFVEGSIDSTGGLYAALAAKRFIQDRIDRDAAADALRARKRFLFEGPSLHTLALTRRCSWPSALWVSSSAAGADMSAETAERLLDTVFMTTSKRVHLELSGGDPLLVFERVKHVVDYARSKNELARKSLSLSLASDLTQMTDEMASFLVDNRVRVRARVDAPATGMDDAARASALGWIRQLEEAVASQGLSPLEYGVEATVVPRADQLGDAASLIDPYLEVGCSSIALKPMQDLDIDAQNTPLEASSLDAFMAFYQEAAQRILDGGKAEVLAATFATRLLGDGEPLHAWSSNPSTSGTGQVAYDPDGGVFTCERGWWVSLLGDDAFRLGSVHENGYHDLVSHPTNSAIVMATALEGQPGWSNHAYAVFCGATPVDNYYEQGSIHGRMGDSPIAMCQIRILDWLFEKLADEAQADGLKGWVLPTA